MGVVSHLKALENKGKIRRLDNTARGIVIMNSNEARREEDIISVPLVGSVACGMPIWPKR
jgi:SOS-response transcriptional repressor LexA